MKSRQSIIIIEDFYSDPHAVRNYALRLQYYTPYEDFEAVRSGQQHATWWASSFRQFNECPFKSSPDLIRALEFAVQEEIDINHWRANFPVDQQTKPLSWKGPRPTCLWNCCFHVKPENEQQLGQGVHNHVSDQWNSVGPDGWTGLIYLAPGAPLDGGLYLWRNIDPKKNYDWMTPPRNWELVDSVGNLFNRLILVRGDIPHSGAGGWGDCLENGRMYQTFFFRTIFKPSLWPVSIPNIAG
jgi:hypothetical protein